MAAADQAPHGEKPDERARRLRREALETAAVRVDVIDLAGRILADPERTRVPTIGLIALARAFEDCWATCIEAELLTRAIDLPEGDFMRPAVIDQQKRTVAERIAALRGEPTKQETD